jgi:hypothetical protein
MLVGQVVLAIYSIGCQLDGSGATVELARYNIFIIRILGGGGGRNFYRRTLSGPLEVGTASIKLKMSHLVLNKNVFFQKYHFFSPKTCSCSKTSAFQNMRIFQNQALREDLH